MFATRVGYTGGKTADPTYRRIGDHTETLEVDFDPKVIGYDKLLKLFFESHNACARPWSSQYMSAIFCNDDEQLRMARAAADQVAKTRGSEVLTRIERAGEFYLAEDYHQKYRLRGQDGIAGELLAIYPKLREFVDSTAATRLNGYLSGYGTKADFERELPDFGLSPRTTEMLRQLVRL